MALTPEELLLAKQRIENIRVMIAKMRPASDPEPSGYKPERKD